MIKLKDILLEGLSSILYHARSVPSLHDILKKDKFKLGSALSSVESEYSGGKFYFMSLSRTKFGGFIRYEVSGNRAYMANLVIDGRKLGNTYKGIQTGYWRNMFHGTEWTTNETEDRLIIDKPEIKNASRYIKEIHILVSKMLVTGIDNVSAFHLDGIIKLAKQKNIPIFFYDYVGAFKTLSKSKTIKFDDVTRIIQNKLSGEDYTSRRIESDIPKSNILYVLSTIILAKKESDINNVYVRDFLYSLRKYKEYRSSIDIEHIENQISSMKFNSKYRTILKNITEYMRKNKLRTLNDMVLSLSYKIETWID